jgi:hypothetical protein
MARTVADYMVQTLKQAGVKRVFGVVGDSLNGFTDALHRAGELDRVHVEAKNFGLSWSIRWRPDRRDRPVCAPRPSPLTK